MKMVRYVALVTAGLGCACAPQPSPDLGRIFATWNSPASPGCAIGIRQDGQTRLAAFGSADLEHRVPNSPASIFEAGSVSKQFTAAAVLLLAQEGKVGLDDDIRKYLPEMPDYGATITIGHLLSHTSGLRDWGTLAEIAGWPRTTRAMNQADVLAMAARQTGLNYAPGAEYSYTNTGYNLLAIIVERVSGQPFPRFTHDRIFQPLGMTSTSWRDDFRRIVADRSIAYVRNGTTYEQQMPFENVIGNGGLLTTVKDLLAWNDALNQQRLGSFVAREMERQALLNDGRRIKYARGVRVTSRNGLAEISHDGATAGYRTWLARFPSRNLSIAILCNAGDVGRSAALHGYEIADPLIGQAPGPAGAEAHMPGRAGLFVSERTGMPFALVWANGALRKESGEILRIESADALRAGDGLLRFEGNDKFVLEDNDGNAEPHLRNAPAVADRAALSAYAGSYKSDEIDTVYAVEEREGHLAMQNRGRPAAAAMRLDPIYKDAFLYDTASGAHTGLARFRRDAGGRVTALDIGLTRRVRALRFSRIAPARN